MIVLKKSLIVAHRCGYKDAKELENSIAALKYCNSKEYIDGIELDCLLTEDKKIVVFHDSFVMIDDKVKNVSKLSFRELDDWYFEKNHSHLNTLEEMLKTVSISKILFIELKNGLLKDDTNTLLIDLVNKEIKKHKLKKTKILCFSERMLNDFYKVNKKESLCLLVSKSSYLYNAKLIYNMYFNKRIHIVAIHKSMVTKKRVKKILQNHSLAIYTIKNKKEMEKILNILGDVYEKYKDQFIIITNVPSVVNKVLNKIN